MEKKYTRARMVNWFEPQMLMQTAIKAVISNLFGNYADRREMQAALPGNSVEDWDKVSTQYPSEEIWLDFISDTGDGFNSTYTIANLAAQDELVVDWKGVKETIPRGKILIMGGDQIYPTPTTEMYDNKFRIPFEAALSKVETDKIKDGPSADQPHMYAIPGNHDWYDGLGNFLKIFCQKRTIGIWKTQQTRSYFAIPLPNNYWLWATDIQLNQDIDKPQQEYFLHIAQTRMKKDDNVILITAEPAWIFKQLYDEDKSYDRFKFFINRYILDNKDNCVGHSFRLAAVLTGDLHHYTHYCSKKEKDNAHHYFGAGGGGAFLHLTHFLPENLTKLDETDIHLETAFPDKKDSGKLLLGNLAFPFINRYFSFILLGVLYFLFFWLLQSPSIVTGETNYMENIKGLPFVDFLKETGRMLLVAPLVSILSFIVVLGIFKFTDTRRNKHWMMFFGLIHGLIQCSLIFIAIRALASVLDPGMLKLTLGNWYWTLLIALVLMVVGGIVGGLLMGVYLYLANRFGGNHIDEASSSLASPHFKNFLRMHIDKQALTVYAIGIRKVTKTWKQVNAGDTIQFEGDLPEYHLIEKVTIKK